MKKERKTMSNNTELREYYYLKTFTEYHTACTCKVQTIEITSENQCKWQINIRNNKIILITNNLNSSDSFLLQTQTKIRKQSSFSKSPQIIEELQELLDEDRYGNHNHHEIQEIIFNYLEEFCERRIIDEIKKEYIIENIDQLVLLSKNQTNVDIKRTEQSKKIKITNNNFLSKQQFLQQWHQRQKHWQEINYKNPYQRINKLSNKNKKKIKECPYTICPELSLYDNAKINNVDILELITTLYFLPLKPPESNHWLLS